MTGRVHVLACGAGLLTIGLLTSPRLAQAANLSFSPAAGTYRVGQTFSVDVDVNAADQAINAGQALITWPADKLHFTSLSIIGSIFSYWSTSPIQRDPGAVFFAGGLPSPGYHDTGGPIVHLTFTAIADGQANLTMSNAQLLADDGEATNILTGTATTTLTIQALGAAGPVPTVTSSTFPDQVAWYHQSTGSVSWNSPPGLQGVNYQVSADAQSTLPENVVTTDTSATVTLPHDGTWYFTLRAKYPTGWSAVGSYTIRSDNTPPDAFQPKIIQDRGSTDPTPVLTFTTTDAVSGIARYTYAIDGDTALPVTSPTDLTGLSAGAHTIEVTAYDQAGNSRTGVATVTISGYAAPQITAVTSPLVLLEPLTVRGMANIGDTISVSVNRQAIGQTTASLGAAQVPAGLNMKVPWAVTSSLFFRPGSWSVTAAATSSTGQTSVASDPVSFTVRGQVITLNGHTVATWSAAWPLAVFVILALGAVVVTLTRLGMSVSRMHRREQAVEDDLQVLREVNKRQPISRQQLDGALQRIEADLDQDATHLRAAARRRLTKRSRS